MTPTHRISALSITAMSMSAVALVLASSALGAQSTQSANAATQREAPPAPGTPKDFRVPPKTSFTLSNGMRVTLVPYGRVPKVAVELAIRTGTIDEGPQDVSLSGVMADMLLEGTTTRSPQDISRQAADMGGSVASSGGAEITTVGGEALSEFAPDFIALIADVIRHPRNQAADLQRVLDNQVRNNAMALAQPGTLAQKQYREMAFGDHPFARSFPDEKMLRAFTVARVKEFHAHNVNATRAHLYISGVFDAAAVEKAVRTAFGDWEAGAPPTENPPTLAARRQLAIVDRPGAVQSSIWMGTPVANPKSSEWASMVVTDALLGGSFGSRITTNIREDKGYTYSPYSFLWNRKGASQWVEVADVTTNVTGASLTEIFKEMNTLRTVAPSAQELDGIKNNVAGVFTIVNSSRGGLINQLQFGDLYDLGDDYLSSYVRRIMAVSPEDVRATAKAHLDPDKVSIAIVGDKKKVEPQLGRFKPIVP